MKPIAPLILCSLIVLVTIFPANATTEDPADKNVGCEEVVDRLRIATEERSGPLDYEWIANSELVETCSADTPYTAAMRDSIMVGGWVNDMHDYTIDKYVSSARKNAKSRAFDVAALAMGTLTIVRQDEDIELLHSIAIKENRLFRAAVHALIFSCSNAGEHVIKELSESVTEKNAAAIEEMRSTFTNWSARESWCMSLASNSYQQAGEN